MIETGTSATIDAPRDAPGTTSERWKRGSSPRAHSQAFGLPRLPRVCSEDDEALLNAFNYCSILTALASRCNLGLVVAPPGKPRGARATSQPSLANDVSATEFVNTMNKDIKDLLLDLIGMKSTAFEGEDGSPDPSLVLRPRQLLVSRARSWSVA
jgi:hypothetical protein